SAGAVALPGRARALELLGGAVVVALEECLRPELVREGQRLKVVVFRCGRDRTFEALIDRHRAFPESRSIGLDDQVTRAKVLGAARSRLPQEALCPRDVATEAQALHERGLPHRST